MSDLEFDVQKIARLAYLELTPEEQRSFQKQFQDVLGYVNQLRAVPMTAAEASQMGAFHITDQFYELFHLSSEEVLREDHAADVVGRLNLTNDEALRNAPQKAGIPGELLFEVPSIIDRE